VGEYTLLVLTTTWRRKAFSVVRKVPEYVKKKIYGKWISSSKIV
jgi:hypothetical protein